MTRRARQALIMLSAATLLVSCGAKAKTQLPPSSSVSTSSTVETAQLETCSALDQFLAVTGAAPIHEAAGKVQDDAARIGNNEMLREAAVEVAQAEARRGEHEAAFIRAKAQCDRMGRPLSHQL